MLIATLNEAIPLRVLAADGRTDLFARFHIYNSSGLLVFTLSAPHIAEGLYSVAWTPAIEGFYTVLAELFFDALFTVSAGYEKVGDTLEVGTLKSSIARILGLHHENAVVDNQAYDGNSNMTAARVRLYDSKANALAAGMAGQVAVYTVSATYDVGGKLSNYTMVRDN